MAALAGLFPIFVVFRMDKLKKDIDQFREMAINGSDRDGHSAFKMSDKQLLEKAREYLRAPERRTISTTFSGQLGNFVFGEPTLTLFEKLINKKGQILKALRNTLILSVICIASAITMLVYSKDFSCCAYSWLSLLLLFTISTLIYIGVSAYKINKI